MRLEDEIKQPSFKSEFLKLRINLIYTTNWLVNHKAKFFKNYKLTPEQFNVLRILRGQHPKPATVNLIIERMLNKASNASRLVDKLAIKGLAVRKINKADRRAVNVFITKKGLSLLSLIDKEEVLLDQLFSHTTESEVKVINDFLDNLRK